MAIETMVEIAFIPVILFVLYRYVWLTRRAWIDTAEELGLDYSYDYGLWRKGFRLEGTYQGAQVAVYVVPEDEGNTLARHSTVFEAAYDNRGSHEMRETGIVRSKKALVETIELMVDHVRRQAGEMPSPQAQSTAQW